jgi:hypothetical protein
MKATASRTVSRAMQINAKNAALFGVMVEIICPAADARAALANGATDYIHAGYRQADCVAASPGGGSDLTASPPREFGARADMVRSVSSGRGRRETTFALSRN